jgi:hypothetical protein
MDRMDSRRQLRTHFELRQGRRGGKHPFVGIRKPPGNLLEAERLQPVRLKADKAQRVPFRVPHANPAVIDGKWPAVGIQRQPRLVRFALPVQRHQEVHSFPLSVAPPVAS